MSVTLLKGQKTDLTKKHPDLQELRLDLAGIYQGPILTSMRVCSCLEEVEK